MDMPSPVIILGDHTVSQNTINSAKRKYKSYKWITFSASDDSPDAIRSAAGQGDFLSSKKVILINDLPNKKATRDFLIDLVGISSDKLKFVIWDSTNAIKVDPKTGTFNKTWADWISELKKNKDHKLVNNGSDFTDKQDKDCSSFIKMRFQKAKKEISDKSALLFAEIVGKNRGMLETEIDKFLLTCPDTITEDFIIQNAYPSSTEAIIYKFGNILDSCSYGKSILMMQQFIDMGINENVLADVMVRKARWQLAAASYWEQGQSWREVSQSLMQMGKYPSSIWHQYTLTPTEKRKHSDGLKEVEDRIKYITKNCGIKERQINLSKKPVRAEVIPMQFMAELTVQFLRKNIITPYVNEYRESELKTKLVDRCIKVYLFSLDKLKEIRYGSNPTQDLQEMVGALTSNRL